MKPIMLAGIALIVLGVIALTTMALHIQLGRKFSRSVLSKLPKKSRKQSRCHPSWAALPLQVGLRWLSSELKSNPVDSH